MPTLSRFQRRVAHMLEYRPRPAVGDARCAPGRCQNRRVIFAVALMVLTGGSGVGLLAWWGQDMLAARRAATDTSTAPAMAPIATGGVYHSGPGLSPQTVAAHADHLGSGPGSAT